MDQYKFISKKLKKLKISNLSPDLEHIKELLADIDPDTNLSISSDINISPINKKKKKNFSKRRLLTLKILYACLKLDVSIFSDNILVNNRTLINLLTKKKREFLLEVNNVITYNTSKMSTLRSVKHKEYQQVFDECILKVRIIDKLMKIIAKLCQKKILRETDTILMLTIPFFFIEKEYIEQYG